MAEGLDNVTSHLGFGRKAQFYLTLMLGLGIGIWAAWSPDRTVEAMSAFFLVAMAFVMASHWSLSARIRVLETCLRQREDRSPFEGGSCSRTV
jgi:hypothetical protein